MVNFELEIDYFASLVMTGKIGKSLRATKLRSNL